MKRNKIKFCLCGKDSNRLKKGLCPACYVKELRRSKPEYYESEKKAAKIRYHEKQGNEEKIRELTAKRCNCGSKIDAHRANCEDCNRKSIETSNSDFVPYKNRGTFVANPRAGNM